MVGGKAGKVAERMEGMRRESLEGESSYDWDCSKPSISLRFKAEGDSKEQADGKKEDVFEACTDVVHSLIDQPGARREKEEAEKEEEDLDSCLGEEDLLINQAEVVEEEDQESRREKGKYT